MGALMGCTRFEDLEVTICGVTFIVTGNFYPEEAAWFNPREGIGSPGAAAWVEILKKEILGQPQGDADTLLESIKIYSPITSQRTTGMDLLEETIIKEMQGCD
jgi:hypothetical protein